MTAVVNDNFFAENWKYLFLAAVLHVAVAALFVISINATRQPVVPGQLAIKAVVIDHTAQRLKREKEKAEADRLAREQAEAEQKAREKAEAERVEKEQQAKREEEQRQTAAAEKRKADEQRKAEEQRKSDERQATARKKADDERKRVAEIKAKQEEKQKSERDAREQAQRESELKRQLADEEGRMQAENSGLLNQYVAMIVQRVERNWNKPSTARSGIQCDVKVAQAPGGTVLSVQIDKCNGDAAVRQSIEAAVYRSSPLPAPPDARLFQRTLVFQFKPAD